MARVVIVGAGLCGLTAGRALAAAGHDVVLLDKGRSPGGRCATRRIGGATFDHGAQFFTVRSDAFAGLVHAWQQSGVVEQWCLGFAGRVDGYPRYRVRHGMNALAKHLSLGLDVRCSTLAFTLRRSGTGWAVVDDTAREHHGDAVVLTTPVPQAFSFLIAAELEVPAGVRAIDYARTLALLVVLEGAPSVPEPGGVQDGDDTFSFVSDNARKGVSAIPALTLHVRAEPSKEWWDVEPGELEALLRGAAATWIGSARVIDSQVKRWRYATPTTIWPESHLVVHAEPPVVLAGDAFGGPKIEGAVRSGQAAAAELLELLPRV